MLVKGGGVIQLFKPKISPNYYFYLKKFKKLYIIKKKLGFFSQSDVINHLYECMIHFVKQIWS
jgi:hypothetical protein